MNITRRSFLQADLASAYRIPISLHNVSGLLLNMDLDYLGATMAPGEPWWG